MKNIILLALYIQNSSFLQSDDIDETHCRRNFEFMHKAHIEPKHTNTTGSCLKHE